MKIQPVSYTVRAGKRKRPVQVIYKPSVKVANPFGAVAIDVKRGKHVNVVT